jgi:hypothetical protein
MATIKKLSIDYYLVEARRTWVFASGTLFIFSYFHIHGRIFASFAPPCTAPPIRSGCVLLDNLQDRLLFVDLLLEKLDVTSDSHRLHFLQFHQQQPLLLSPCF